MSQISPETISILNKNKERNPDIRFELWDDKDIEEFIRSEFRREVYEAYMSINPVLGAAKADFFRYCIIYKRGGIYLDLKSFIKIPYLFGNIIQSDDEAILDIRRDSKEPYRKIWGYGSYEQWFLVYKPGHPYLEKMINTMTRFINQRIEFELDNSAKVVKQQVLRLTGPDCYSLAIHEAILQHGKHHRELSYFKWLRYRIDRTSEYKHLNLVHYSDQTHSSLYDINRKPFTHHE